ncbi:hypothetical protein A0O28_0053680 [Trichoderma guizhouense]|uniref:GATA-type domain-containing protein n=1 Tax=Trichoderma guizhouense TaxID=1491466 RepID=A0A1T3C5G9_9HYPO|nr:hypothetical protein A0O28_0053680 [Trichoderma guizhouense]
MSRRRQYIKYREEHSKKLAHGLLDEPGEGENATTIASSIPKKLKDEENAAIFTKMDALLDNMSEISGTSYANSNAGTNELRVPSIPKDQESFEKHVTTIHGQNFESVDLQAVLNLCRVPSDTNTVGTCPFCFDYEIKSDKSYQSHIGDHLERLALFVLPKTLYDDDSDDDDNNDEDGEGDNNDDGVDSDIEMRLMKDDEYSNDLEESRGGDGGENEELDEEKMRARMDYQMQLELLEQDNKKRLEMARRQAMRSGTRSIRNNLTGEELDEDTMQPLHALQDYNMQLALLEQQARQEQSKMEGTSRDGQPDIPAGFDGQPSPGTSPQAMGSGASPNPEEQMNNSSIHDSWENEEPDEGNTESTHPLMDYNMQLELLEQANKKRLMRARQEQSELEGIHQDSQSGPAGSNDGQPFPDTSPQETRSESSPTFGEIDRKMSRMNNSDIHDSRKDEELNKGKTESTHPLMDYMPQLELLEQANKKRLMMARQEQSEMGKFSRDSQPSTPARSNNGQAFPDISPIATKSGASLNPDEQMKRGISQMDNSSIHDSWDNEKLDEGNTTYGNHALQDYQMQLMQLERENKKRFVMVRQEQSEMEGIPRDSQPSTPSGPNGQPSPDISPMAAKSGASGPSPNLKDRIRRIISHMDGFDASSFIPDDGQSLESPAMGFLGSNQVNISMPPHLYKGTDEGNMGRAQMNSTNLPGKKVSFAKGEDGQGLDADISSHDRLPPPSDTSASSLKRYGSLSTFHGEGPIETSPISAPRAITPPGSDTIVLRPLDYSEDGDAAEEQRRLEEQSRELKELKRKGDILAEKHINMKIEYRRLKEEDGADAAEKMRRLERELDDETELRYLQKQLDAIKEREANAKIWRLVERESDIVVEKRINKEAEYRRLKEEDSADAAERIRIRELDATQKREAGAIEKRIMKEPELRSLIEEEYAAEASDGKRRLEGDFREDGENSKEEDQDVPMDWDSIEPPFTDGVMEVEKRRSSAALPKRCHSCNRIDTPLWRRGPDGERNLCNACALHYDRKRLLEARLLGPKPEERDAADAAERIRIVSDMFRDDAGSSSLREQLDAIEREARVEFEKRKEKEKRLKLAEEFAELKRLDDEEYRDDV